MMGESRRPLEPEPDNTGGGKNMDRNTTVSSINTRILAEAIVFIALSNALYILSKFYFPFLKMPQGGSVTLASMVPLLWFALRRGLRWGVEAGLVYGLVHMVISGEIYYPTQVLLDYPLAFGALGLAGAFKKYPVLGVGVAITGRFVCHFLSGVIFFGQYAWEGWHPVLYSAAYNATYLVPEFIVSAIIIYILLKRRLLEVHL
jgi:thiamine transporter